MDLEALRSKALQTLRPRQPSEQTSQNEPISGKENILAEVTDFEGDKPHITDDREEGELSESPEVKKRSYSHVRYNQTYNHPLERRRPFQSRFSQKRTYQHTASYSWDGFSPADLLGKLDHLNVLITESQETEEQLRLRWMKCRKIKREAMKQRSSLSAHLNHLSRDNNTSKNHPPIIPPNRWQVHQIMKDSALLCFPERFKSHPAFDAFVIRCDSLTFTHSPFDPNLPFCLQEACFGSCECDTDDQTSFNHLCKL